MEGYQITNIISEQEEKMGTLRQLFKLNGTAWSFTIGLLLAGLLSGCGLPFIDVDVNVVAMGGACPSGRGGPVPGPSGGCNPFADITQNTPATSLYAYDSVSRLKITNSSLICLAGGKSSTGGVCSYTKPCRTWYHAIAGTNTGNCTAGCDP